MLTRREIILDAAKGSIAGHFASIAAAISAGVGFIALFGVAVLNGVVLVTSILEHRRGGQNRHDAVVDEDARKEALKGLDDELAGRGGGAQGVDILKGGRAVNLGLAPAKQVEIGAMKNQDHHDLSIRWGFVASGSVVPLKTIGFFRWTTP